MSHTPGPWGLNKTIEVWVMAGPIHVATIPRAYDGDWSEANARLIAAAPTMLEALQNIKTDLIAMGLWNYYNFDKAMGLSGACNEIDAAIAQAKGEA